MNHPYSLNAAIINSRLAIIGRHEFALLDLTPEEIRIFLTVLDRKAWTERMQVLIPHFAEIDKDEEEL